MYGEGGTSVTDADLRFAPLTAVSGTVRVAGSPLPGATVRAFLPHDRLLPTFATSTAADGTYSFRVDVGSTVRLLVDPARGSGLTPRWYPGVTKRANATPLVVADPPATGVDVAIDSSTLVSGVVTGPGGVPVAGAKVSAFEVRDTGWFSAGSTVTDASGRYSLLGLDPDEYQVRVAPPAGSGVAACWYPSTLVRNLAPRVTLAASQSMTGIDVSCPAT